jgi:hypothetical protein
MITKGYMIDSALGGLSALIPSHPTTAAGTAIEYGAINNIGTLEV